MVCLVIAVRFLEPLFVNSKMATVSDSQFRSCRVQGCYQVPVHASALSVSILKAKKVSIPLRVVQGVQCASNQS